MHVILTLGTPDAQVTTLTSNRVLSGEASGRGPGNLPQMCIKPPAGMARHIQQLISPSTQRRSPLVWARPAILLQVFQFERDGKQDTKKAGWKSFRKQAPGSHNAAEAELELSHELALI